MYNVSVRGEEKTDPRRKSKREEGSIERGKRGARPKGNECGHHNCTRTSVPEGGLTKDGGRGASREAVVSVGSGGQGRARRARRAWRAAAVSGSTGTGSGSAGRAGATEESGGGGIGRGSTHQQTRTRLFRQSCPGKIVRGYGISNLLLDCRKSRVDAHFLEKAVPSMLSRWDAETHATTLRILGATGANTQGASPIEAGERQERQRPDEGVLRAKPERAKAYGYYWLG
ncbi:hypothetical protein B0H14DRAFT_3134255 [Mycena olivaceomarginata]|nr:hypothetical protein B0H14DRAFT_3134255 [Mycena olivaceomarginata]